MIKKANKYSLRGIVSVALADSVTKSCDTTKFFVFTDVAKLVGWVKSVMK